MPTLDKASPEELVRIFTSGTFALIPSDSDTRLQIHERLLSVSPSLHSVCEKRWMEQNKKEYKFKEFNKDEDTDSEHFVEVTKEVLICFIRWAYLGDYSTEAAGISSHIVEDIKKFSKKERKKARHQEWGIPAAVVFGEHIIEEEAPAEESERPDILDKTIDDGGLFNHYDAIHPLLLNAQIYTFANIYLIDSLQSLARRKIIDYLSRAENSSKDFMQPIFDILEYAYSNLPDNDALLDWLALYSGWKLGDLKSSARLENVLRMRNGIFAALLVKHLQPSLTDPFVEEELPWPVDE